MVSVTKLIRQDSQTYPHFLSDNWLSHISAMDELSAIFNSIMHIDVESFIEQSILDGVVKFIQMKLDRISKIVDYQTYLRCVDHIRYRVYVYRQIWEEKECYEQMANLDRVFSLIFKNKKHII